MHRRTVCRMGMEEILEFLQIRLAQNFGYADNVVVEAVEKCMEEMKRLKLDLPKQIPDLELAQKPFGVFQTPSVDVAIGRRRTEFSEEEKFTRATVVARMELQVSFSFATYHCDFERLAALKEYWNIERKELKIVFKHCEGSQRIPKNSWMIPYNSKEPSKSPNKRKNP